MADYIFIRKSRNVLSSILHVAFNIALGVGSILLTIISGSWILGILLVLLSKWRTFAVRPRYWWINIKSSLVDLIVGSSFVFVAYCAGTTLLPVHYLLAIGYTIWLLFLKPLSSEHATEIQALTAVFLGSTAATMMTASANPFFLSLLCFIIYYGAARHVLIQSEDQNYEIIPLVAGLLGAEIAWLCQHWLIVYMFNNSGIIVPQLSVILALLAFALGATYKSIIKHDGELKLSSVAMPLIFTTLLISIIVIWFSQPIFNV